MAGSFLYGQNKGRVTGTRYFWQEPLGSESQARAVASTLALLEKQNVAVDIADAVFFRMYAGIQAMGSFLGYGPVAAPIVSTDPQSVGRSYQLNVCQSCVDTITSKMVANKPKPTFVTDGGDYKLQQYAKKMDKFVQGVFYENNVQQELLAKWICDACWEGNGYLYPYFDDDTERICIERVFPNEVVVDDVEAANGEPRTIFRRKYWARERLLAFYGDSPTKRSAIMQAKRSENTRTQADMILTREAWHRPSKKDGSDGVHVLSVDSACLFSEAYKYDRMPFAQLKWLNRPVGYRGEGICEQLMSIQVELNRAAAVKTEAIRMFALPKIWVDASSDINVTHINNDMGAIGMFTGAPPVFTKNEPVSEDLKEHIENLFEKAYKMVGLSEMAAQSIKPAGLDSGAAQRAYHDITSERFQTFGQGIEEGVRQLAMLVVDLGIDNFGDGKKRKSYVVRFPGKRTIEEIDWKDAPLERDDFSVKIWPTSLLPSTPAGRQAAIQDLLKAGLISQSRATSLLDFPDLEADTSLESAAIDRIMQAIEAVLDDDPFIGPDPFGNYEMGVAMMQGAYLRAQTANVPEEKLELMRRYVEYCQDGMSAAQPPAAPPAQAGAGGPALGGPPQATPMPAPQSPLLPQAMPQAA